MAVVVAMFLRTLMIAAIVLPVWGWNVGAPVGRVVGAGGTGAIAGGTSLWISGASVGDGRKIVVGCGADDCVGDERFVYDGGGGFGADWFTGAYRDDQVNEWSGDYFGARHFNRAPGRFSTPDENLVDQHAGDPLSWNLFSYVRNNPLRFVDPTGRCSKAANGYTDDGEELFPGTCADGIIGDSDSNTNSVAVGIGSDEARLMMLAGIGEGLSSRHSQASVVGGAVREAASMWGLHSISTAAKFVTRLLRGPGVIRLGLDGAAETATLTAEAEELLIVNGERIRGFTKHGFIELSETAGSAGGQGPRQS